MGQDIELSAADGHRLAAYMSSPGTPRGGIVVIQEIFGVTRHIRAVADQYAAAGFTAIAPALFDRVERNVDVPYTDMAKGYGYMQQLKNEQVMLDVQAAIKRLDPAGKVGVVGYCWGGTLAWVSNTRLRPDATVSYYPGGIQNYIHERFTCPAIFHFGLDDNHIPQSVVEEVRHEYPGFSVFTYEGAGHAFNRDGGPSYNEAAAKLAQQRTLAHFDEYLVAAH
jgi:carboxymethylenebutenolidase